jgi:hypothetical protein
MVDIVFVGHLGGERVTAAERAASRRAAVEFGNHDG